MSVKEISVRQKKVSEQVRRLVSEYLMLDLLRDNPIKNMISITKVNVTSDLRMANIYITIHNSDEKVCHLVKNILESFISKTRAMLSQKMFLKFIPAVKYIMENERGCKNNTSLLVDQKFSIDDIL